MASNLASDTFLADRRIRARYFHIPKAQKNLLENDSAWSENLSRGPHGMLNLPDRVLQDAKDFHSRKTMQSSIPREPSASRSGQPQPPSSPPGQDPGDDEEPHALSSWAPSPREHYYPPPPPPLPQSQTKRKSPPLLFEGEPSSSGAVSEPLDLEPPGFLTQEHGSPVNKAASRLAATDIGRPEPTPPSAQLPVGTGHSVRQPPPAKKRRVMGEIRAADGNALWLRDQEVVHKAPSKPLTGQHNNHQDRSTTNVPTHSLKSQVAQERRIQAGASRSMSDPATYQQHSSLTPSWEGRRQELDARKVIHTGTQIPGPSLAPPPAQRNPVDQSIPSAMQPSQRLSMPGSARTPYEEYKVAYPDYSENIRKFISACLSVNQLRRDKQLPEFIYDDFVRAYSSDYLLYVSECSRKKADKLLPGIQWYNHYVKDMQYTKKLIRKDNLAAILEAHKNEVHSVRRALGDSQSTASNSDVEESDEDLIDALEEEQPGEEPDIVELEDCEADDERASLVSPELHIESPRLSRIQGSLKQMHEGIPSTFNEAADEQADSDVAEEDHDGDMLMRMDTSRESPALQVLPLSAVRPTATPKRNGASRTHRTLTPTPNTAFASQEKYRWPGTPEDLHNSEFPEAFRSASRPGSSPAFKATSIQQTPAASASQRGARPRSLSADDDEEELAFDPPVPRSPPKRAAQSSPAVQPGPVSAAAAPPASTSISLAVDRRPLSSQGNGNEAAPRRTSKTYSLAAGRDQSPASSARTYANVPQSKKRSGETRSQRIRNLKAFMEKRLSAGTPNSTSTSRKQNQK